MLTFARGRSGRRPDWYRQVGIPSPFPTHFASADFSRQPGLSGDYPQTEVLGERIEIPVAVQQFVPALDASGCNHCIDGLTNGYASLAQCAKILRRLNGDFLSAQLHHHQRSQHFPGVIEIPFIWKALQDLSQNQVTDGQWL